MTTIIARIHNLLAGTVSESLPSDNDGFKFNASQARYQHFSPFIIQQFNVLEDAKNYVVSCYPSDVHKYIRWYSFECDQNDPQKAIVKELR